MRGASFSAPEGRLTARAHNSEELDGGRSSLLLWFYHPNGLPAEVNLTAIVSDEAFQRDPEGYRMKLFTRIQEWLSGIRDGESTVDLGTETGQKSP